LPGPAGGVYSAPQIPYLDLGKGWGGGPGLGKGEMKEGKMGKAGGKEWA